MTLNIRDEKATENSKRLRGELTLTLAFAVALSFQIQPAMAADFSHAQKVYVPSTNYDRRVDFSSIREQYSKSSTTGAGSSAAKPKASSSYSPKKGAVKTTPPLTASASATSSVKSTGKSSSKSGAGKAASHHGPVQTVVHDELPAPALNGKSATGKSFNEIAKTLSSKVPPSLINKMKAQALELEKSGKLDDAQRVLTKITQMTPEDKAALQQVATVSVQRAKNYLKSNNLNDALLAARQALAASPNDVEAHNVLSDLYKKVGADPTDIKSRLQTAHSLYNQGRYQEAEVEYRASLHVKATPDAHIGLGKVAQKLQGDTAGKAHFEHALELDSNSSHAHRELGMHHLKSGDIVSANSELSRALVIDPKDKDAGQHLVRLWQGQVSKTATVASSNPQLAANSHLGLARAYQLTGELQSAQAEYKEVVRIYPEHPYLPAARQSFKIALAKQEAEKAVTAAKTLEQQGLINEAYSRMNDAVAYAPGNSAYKIYQGELLEKLGQQAQAKQVYLNVLKDDPQNLTAVQKIKGLANIAAAAGTVGMSAAGLAGLLPGGSGPPKHPSGFPGSKFPMDMTADATQLTTVGGAVGAAPVQRIDQVDQIAGFGVALRNHMLMSKVANQKVEDAAHKIIKQLTEPPEDPPAAGAGGGGAAAAGASDDDIVKKILNSPSPKADASVSGAESGAAAALANAAAALAAIKNGGAGAAAKAPTSAAKASSGAKADATKATSAGSATAAAGTSKTANQRLQDLEKQNQALQEQLKQLQAQQMAANASTNGNSGIVPPLPPVPQAAELPPAAPDFGGFGPLSGPGEPVSTSLPGQLPYGSAAAAATDPLSALVAPIAGSAAEAGIPQAMPPYQGGVPQGYPSAVPQGYPAGIPQSMGMPQGGIPQGAPDASQQLLSSQPIKFELKNIRPTLSHVQLKVSLRNDTNAPLEIPGNLQAVVKYPNQTEAEMKIAFDSKMVLPHSTVDGVVKVPFSKVDPTADMVLRNLIPNQELHIIKTAVSVSQ